MGDEREGSRHALATASAETRRLGVTSAAAAGATSATRRDDARRGEACGARRRESAAEVDDMDATALLADMHGRDRGARREVCAEGRGTHTGAGMPICVDDPALRHYERITRN